MRKIPETFKAFGRRFPSAAAAYEQFAAECHGAGPLVARERMLVKLGIAAGSNVEGSVNSQVRKALDLGMTPEEIRHAIVLSATAIGFPRMMKSLVWAEKILDAGAVPEVEL